MTNQLKLIFPKNLWVLISKGLKHLNAVFCRTALATQGLLIRLAGRVEWFKGPDSEEEIGEKEKPIIV